MEDYLLQISQLPQSGIISEDDARRWVDRTLNVDPDRIDWHIARAGGFGGSEMGALVAAMERRPHRLTPNRLVKNKLLKLPPSSPDDDMRRGIELEDHVRACFEGHLDQSGVIWNRRDDVRKLIEQSPNEQLPWMRSSLDGLYEIEGALYIIDFKAPMPDVLEGYRRYQNYDDYRVQTHHYRYDAVCKGIEIDGIALAIYDYKRNGVEIFEIEHDPALDAKILDAGDLYWNRFVMRGEVPDLDLPQYAVPEGGVPEEIETAARHYEVTKMIADSATKTTEKLRGEVENWVSRTGHLEDAVLTLANFMEIKAKPALDCDAAVERLGELGWSDKDLDDLRGPAEYDRKKVITAYDAILRLNRKIVDGLKENVDIATYLEDLEALIENAPAKKKGAWDPEKVSAALVSCNENPEYFFTERLSSALPRKKNIALDECKEMVASEIDGLVRELARAPAAEESLDEELQPRAIP